MPGVGTTLVGDSAFTAMLSAYSSAARPVENRSIAALHMPYTVPPRPANGPGGIVRMQGGDRGDVEDPAARRRSRMPGRTSRRQVERRLDLDGEHQLVLLRGEVLDPGEVRDRGVVHQDVGRAELASRLGDEPLPVLGLGQVGGDRDRGAARGPDLRRRSRRSSRRTAMCQARWSWPRPRPPRPRRRIACAISAPMPRLAPVTMATLPSSRPMQDLRACSGIGKPAAERNTRSVFY